jgi:DNA-binding response OmpR family regulator
VPHRVLIASYDADLSAAYAAALSDCGFDVERVTTGLDCLARYRAWHPEVMLVTQNLLWGSGPDVLAVIHDEESNPAPAVVMTEDTTQARVHLRPQWHDCLVTTLLRPNLLCAVVRALTDRGSGVGCQGPMEESGEQTRPFVVDPESPG